MPHEPWVRGTELGPDELRVLGEVTLAVLRRLDAARDAGSADAEDDELVSFLSDTPLAFVLQEAVEHLSSQVRFNRHLSDRSQLQRVTLSACLPGSLAAILHLRGSVDMMGVLCGGNLRRGPNGYSRLPLYSDLIRHHKGMQSPWTREG